VDVEREPVSLGQRLCGVIGLTQDIVVPEDHDGQVLFPVPEKREIGPGEPVLREEGCEKVVDASSPKLHIPFAIVSHPVDELLSSEDSDLDFHNALSLSSAEEMEYWSNGVMGQTWNQERGERVFINPRNLIVALFRHFVIPSLHDSITPTLRFCIFFLAAGPAARRVIISHR
jgi:hypothetical protein